MDHVKIQIICAKIKAACFKRLQRLFITTVNVPDLACKEQLLAGQACLCDSSPDIFFISVDSGTVKVSRSLKELGMRVQAAREHHMKVCGTEPTLSQLAEELNEPTENITLAIQAAQPAMSLTPENEEEDRQMDIPVESPEEALAERISLEEVLHALPEQDRQLIRLRFYGNKTQSETAKVLHTTQVQISRRERKILVQLRRRLLED